MPHVRFLLVAGLLGASFPGLFAQEPASKNEKPPETIALPVLRQELLERRERDQAVRNESIASGAEHPDPAIVERMRRIDGENTARVKEIVREHGWPGPELVGSDGTQAAWLIVQHSTPEFQKEMLPLVKEAYLAKKLQGSSYALLLDRVLVHEGKPQVYGSQGRWENGVLNLQPIEDEANVDKRRAEVGLGPLADYLERLREFYKSKPPTPVPQPAGTRPQTSSMALASPYARLVAAEKELADATMALESATPEDRAKKRDDVWSARQRLAWALSDVGDYAGALASFRSDSERGSAATPIDPEKAREVITGYKPVDAIAAIVEAARDRQVVILNEAHHISRHRAFALLVARELRKLGFDYLACETFASGLDGEALRARGYPLRRDGTFTREPMFADFVRQSLKLGYRPVGYEFSWSGNREPRSPADSINEREIAQATNLVERIFKKDPQARVFIYVGFSHLMKNEQNRSAQPDRRVQWMAGRLKGMTGIDPLTIDQVAMTDPAEGSLHAAVLKELFPDPAAGAGALVLRSADGKQFLVRGTYAGDADLQVFHSLTREVDGRPDWLAMGGYRKPRAIPAELLPASGRRLVQAFVADESGAVTAMDQFLVEAGAAKPPVFMLPEGSYRFAFEE